MRLLVLSALLLASCVAYKPAPLVSATFASKPEEAFFLLRAFEFHGHSRPLVLGKGVDFRGSIHKLELLKQLVNSDSVKATDFILVCDGYFSFVTAGQSDFIRNFMTFRADVVFAAKAGTSGRPEAPDAPTRFQYLSSGALMARVYILKEILQLNFSAFETDADFYKSVFTSKRFNIKLDVNKVLFCALVDHENDRNDLSTVSGGRFLVKETSSTPLLLFGSKIEGMHAFFRILRRQIQPKIRISNIKIHPQLLHIGETLWFELDLSNLNDFPLLNHRPNPAHVYNASRTFSDDSFPGESAGFRIGVDYEGRKGVDHPWRWGFGENIASKSQKTLILGVVMTECFENREFDLGYVFEEFFWVIGIWKQRITVRGCLTE